jgi:hypothetical protein
LSLCCFVFIFKLAFGQSEVYSKAFIIIINKKITLLIECIRAYKFFDKNWTNEMFIRSTF